MPKLDLTKARELALKVWEWVCWATGALWRSTVALVANPLTYPAIALVAVLGWSGGHLWGARHQKALRQNVTAVSMALAGSTKELERARARIASLEETLTQMQTAANAPAPAPPAPRRAKPAAAPKPASAPTTSWPWSN